MRYRSLMLTLTIALLGCTARERVLQPESEVYAGPIIDMHLHAFTDASPLLGMTHPPTLRGETYEGPLTQQVF